MRNLFLVFTFIAGALPSWAYTNTCSKQIQKTYVREFDGYSAASVEMPKNLEAAEKLVYNYSPHPLDKEKYLKMLRRNEVVVFSSTWASSQYDGVNLVILNSQNCQEIKSFIIRAAD